jgi:hypothetical protein
MRFWRRFSGAIPILGIAAFFFSAGVVVRGTLAGNGGTMAETRQELKSKKAKSKASGTTRKRTGRGVAGEESAGKDGAERLRWAADRRLGRNSEKLAAMLAGKALKGDLASTKVLLGLAEGKKPVAEVKGQVRSLALRLAGEPMREPPVDWKEGLWTVN